MIPSIQSPADPLTSTADGCAGAVRRQGLGALLVLVLLRFGRSQLIDSVATRSGTAHGFDTIVDDTNFAGGAFSFFDQQGIVLTSTGVALTNPQPLAQSAQQQRRRPGELRQSRNLCFQCGRGFQRDDELARLRQCSYLRFDRTEPLEILLFQNPIRHSIGDDLGFGFNIVRR